MRKKNTAKSVRISKKRVFAKKLVSTFIVCALFTAAITAGVVTYIRGECISVSGQASQSIKLGYDKGLGEPFIRMAITELSGHNDITDTFVAVYDENGDYYICPEDTAILSVRSPVSRIRDGPSNSNSGWSALTASPSATCQVIFTSSPAS